LGDGLRSVFVSVASMSACMPASADAREGDVDVDDHRSCSSRARESPRLTCSACPRLVSSRGRRYTQGRLMPTALIRSATEIPGLVRGLVPTTGLSGRDEPRGGAGCRRRLNTDPVSPRRQGVNFGAALTPVSPWAQTRS
jgi:hypothetical protein